MHTKGKSAKLTRGQQLGDNAKLPELNELSYIADMATECGLYETGWADVQGWSQATGTSITPWEATAIRRMITAYTRAVFEYDGKDLPQPYTALNIDKAGVAKAMKETMRGGKRGRHN